MGYDLKQIDDAVMSTQSLNKDDVLNDLATSGSWIESLFEIEP